MRDEEFTNLALRYLDRVITREEMDALNAELADNPQRQREFRQLCVRSQVMIDAMGGRRELREREREAATRGARGAGALRFPAIARWALAASVTLAAAVGLTLMRSAERTSPEARSEVATTPRPVATLADTRGAVWGGGAAREMMAIGADIDSGPLRLEAGTAQLVLRSGAVVMLIGETDVQMVGENRCELRRGTLVATVPERAHGFTVDVPGGSVVDLGTRFGVHVDGDGVAEVHVMEGRVRMEMSPVAGGAAPTRELTSEQAVRVAGDGRATEASYRVDRFMAAKPGAPLVGGRAVLLPDAPASISSNGFESDHRIAVFRERAGVELRKDVAVTFTEPGDYAEDFSDRGLRVPAGTRVSSYMVQFDPVGNSLERRVAASGSVTFAQPIVGVIGRTEQLNATDESLGAPGTVYRAGRDSSRYLENDDRVSISADRRTLTLYLTATSSNDHVRVLVAAPDGEDQR